jgi:TPR repeat protein
MERTAHQGLASAQLGLAEMMEAGESGPPDPASAAQVLKQATNQGVAEAKIRLAEMLEGGRGIDPDLGSAYALYTNVSKLDPGSDPEAIKVRDGAAKKSAALKTRLTADELKKAEDLLNLKKP